MKKILTLVFLSIFCLNSINAEVTWNLSYDGILTISGEMPYIGNATSAPWYSQRDRIKNVIIENGVTAIKDFAFVECSNLTSITIPNSVKSIGIESFRGCSSLTSITIPNSVTSIGDYTFSGCSNLISINIPEFVTGIGRSVFYECFSLASISIPNSVTSIGDYAFYRCMRLASINIPEYVTSIGTYAFYGCSSLTSITIPHPVTIINSRTFYGCSSLTSINIPESVTKIGSYAFQNCSDLSSITIPNSVTTIGNNAFGGCYILENNFVNNSNCAIDFNNVVFIDTEQEDGLLIKNNEVKRCRKWATSVSIPNSVTSIERSAFSGCSKLTSVTIGNSVINIENGTFSDCSNLTSVTIGNSVTSIGGAAFKGCSALTSVTIPKSVTSIVRSAFYGCSGLTSIIVEKGNKTYDSRNDCNAIIETKSNTLIYGSNNAVIPNTVTSIGEKAFYNCSTLTSITIPNSVISIGASAFWGCSVLTSITIPESVTTIGEAAFDGTKLRNIVIKTNTPPSGGSAFSNQSYYHATLMIPEGNWDAYAYSDNWYQFINIREMVYKTANLTNSKAYMMKSETEGSYLFYDSMNDCIGELKEYALDDTEENNTWMTVEVEGKHYVYNLGAKKFLVSGKAKGYSLSDTPASIDIEDGKDAIVFGKSKEFYMVINDKLNVLEDLESQIMTTTGIKNTSAEANQPTVAYNVNGQIVPDNTKGLHIRNGKKVVVK